MQRRLALALALTALAAVVLVGLGVVLQANRGARSEATDNVTRAAEAIAELAAGTRRLGDFARQLAQSRQAFDLEALQVVSVGGDGEVVQIGGTPRIGRGEPPPLGDPMPAELPSRLDLEQLETFRAGDPVVVDGDGVIIVLVELDVDTPDFRRTDGRLGLVAAERVLALPRRAIGWFLWSSLVVLAGASLAGAMLARRLVRPIRAIQQTTASIAAGDLQARTEVTGDDELADLGNSVNAMATELERSKQLDQQFLMSISHDLRTPLTAIGGYAEALIDGTATDGAAIGGIIGQQAHRLERLVQDLLDLARLDANQFRLHPSAMDLAVITGRSVAEMAATATALGVDLRFKREAGVAVPVHADPDRVAQVVGNLVDNALKFADGSVVVEVGCDGSDGVVSVRDDGPGIDSADLPHIFDRLYSGRIQPKRSESSTGLGLTIVRELTIAMGGSVTVTRNTNRGTRFEMRLPLAAGSGEV
ncbi:MAG: HAMP domain-containing histidine kinase [Acidimicrobiia bacterium]|nr:HAMP domain-containing histidine kinase [Acidimicrobiia bacterium]